MNVQAINSDIRDEVLGVLHYYVLFQYPLTLEEIYKNAPVKCALSDILNTLEDLVRQRIVHTYKGYYSTDSNIIAMVKRRQRGNTLAVIKEHAARRAAAIIYAFPFVKFVGISGSLSKGFAEKKSDFDFFIVTEKNRLWICRTLLHLFKKFTFIIGQQHKFCMNYFLDTDQLEIEDKNRYTAIELTSLVPVYGTDTYYSLMQKNGWVHRFLPNGYYRDNKEEWITDNNNFIKRFFEVCINCLKADKWNQQLMRLTDARWRRKWSRKNYPCSDYDVAFKTTLHISKNHPANYQKKVLKHMAEQPHLSLVVKAI